MAIYLIGFPSVPALRVAEIADSLLQQGGVQFWPGLWFIELPVHPEHRVQGLFQIRALVMEFDASKAAFFAGPVAPDARLFLAEKLGPLIVGGRPEAERGAFVRYYGDGERIFGEVVERYRCADMDGSRTTSLCQIMLQRGSDKGVGWHNYTTFYSELFKDIRKTTRTVFEVGLGTNNIDVASNMGEEGVPGASLRGWRDFFANAFIYGADVDRRVLFDDDRIRTFFVDQTRRETFEDLWCEIPDVEIDLFIDDGLHTLQAAETTFDASISRIRNGGLYVIEDVWNVHADAYIRMLDKRGFSGLFLRLPHPLNIHDNGLIIVSA